MRGISARHNAIVRQIDKQGIHLDGGEIRLRILRDIMGAKIDQRADYVILTGCNHPPRFYPLKAFIGLLKDFGVSYTFLSTEYCCGSPLLPKQFPGQGSKETLRLEALAGELQRRNHSAARNLGGQTLVTFCANCYARYSNHSAYGGLPILYYADFLSQIIPQMTLAMQCDFYEGCHRDQHLVRPGAIDPSTSKGLLQRVQGLQFHEIQPEICCRQRPADIFGAMETKTLLTATPCCYGVLYPMRPEAVMVKSLPELLIEANTNGRAIDAGRSQI